MSNSTMENTTMTEETNTPPATTGGIAAEHLQAFFDRIERLQSEKDGISADIREVYDEAKSQGFDTKIMRAVIRLRKLSEPDRQEQDSLMELYRHATGT